MLLISCPDRPGLVAATAGILHRHGANIVSADQHTDAAHGLFLQRIEYTLAPDADADALGADLAAVAAELGMTLERRDPTATGRVAILVSKEGHCLYDLLSRVALGDIRAEVPIVISNHDDHREVTERFGVPFLHLPVQAGNDRVLKAMNRSHTADSYLRVLDQVRVARPDIALSGDFIVGFPGETDAEFEDTMRIVEQVGYAQCFSFKYSARPGTPAATLDNQVPVDVMDERLSRLQAALIASQLAFNQATVGRKCAVLVERTGRHPGQWVGKSPWLQSVYFSGAAEIGDLVEVELTEAGTHSLAARLLEPATA